MLGIVAYSEFEGIDRPHPVCVGDRDILQHFQLLLLLRYGATLPDSLPSNNTTSITAVQKGKQNYRFQEDSFHDLSPDKTAGYTLRGLCT